MELSSRADRRLPSLRQGLLILCYTTAYGLAMFSTIGELSEKLEDALVEERYLETDVRDSNQVMVGGSSLEESRESVEESKRVKLCVFIILHSPSHSNYTDVAEPADCPCFCFSPNQLGDVRTWNERSGINNSGRRIWVFVITAIILTSIAFTPCLVAKTFRKSRLEWLKGNYCLSRSQRVYWVFNEILPVLLKRAINKLPLPEKFFLKRSN